MLLYPIGLISIKNQSQPSNYTSVENKMKICYSIEVPGVQKTKKHFCIRYLIIRNTSKLQILENHMTSKVFPFKIFSSSMENILAIKERDKKSENILNITAQFNVLTVFQYDELEE